MDNCEKCYQIICGGCGWVATARDTLMIQAGYLKQCPLCGWMPGDILENEAETL